MNTQQFRHDLRRGLGSCYIKLQRCDDPEIYREDILWGIKHAFAYDAQCEGTRGGYLFSLIEQFNDWSDFCELAANRANKNVKDRGQKFWHYSQIVVLMAGAGYEPAAQHVWDLYEHMLLELRSGRHTKCGTWPARDNMSFLCVAIIAYMCDTDYERISFLRRVLADYGSIMKMRPNLVTSIEDEWLESYADGELGKERIWELLKEQNNPNIDLYLKQWKKREIEWKSSISHSADKDIPVKSAEEIYIELKNHRDKPFVVIQWTRRLEKTGNTEELSKLIRIYTTEPDDWVRYALLFVIRTDIQASFFDKEAINRVFVDSRNRNAHLRGEATRVLTLIRDEMVRKYAVRRIKTGITDIDTINILIRNYIKGDGNMLIGLIKSVSANERNDFCHGLFSDIRDLLNENKDAEEEMAEELLPYLYREGNCSNCRREVLELMKHRDIFTPELAEECKHDCNEDIREMAL